MKREVWFPTVSDTGVRVADIACGADWGKKMDTRDLVPRVSRELARRKAALISAVGDSRAARGVAYARDIGPRVRDSRDALISAVGDSRAARGVAYARDLVPRVRHDLVPRVRERLGWGVDSSPCVADPAATATEATGPASRRVRGWALDWDGQALFECDDETPGGPAFRTVRRVD
ncbi:MAG: hypothetical protein E3J64_01810 [Anaerolineales bacterium]|nr:MAG: hypothetical protein E3J64_01810 [Anaerolineales bacterium]